MIILIKYIQMYLLECIFDIALWIFHRFTFRSLSFLKRKVL